MTSLTSPNLQASVLSTNTNSSKNSSPTNIKREVNNHTVRTSNGNSSKTITLHKKEPTQTSPIKRKSRVLSSSEDSDDDNQSLVSTTTSNRIIFPPSFFLSICLYNNSFFDILCLFS